MLNDASFFITQEKFADAAAIGMAVVEVIPNNYENVDDSSGDLGGNFEEAVELLCSIVKNDTVNAAIKRQIYDWSKEQVNDQVYFDYGCDDIQVIFETCCQEHDDVNEVLADLDRQINVAADAYSKSQAVQLKIRFMQSKDLNVQETIDQYIDIDAVRRIRFEQLKNAGQYDEALDVANKGIEIAMIQGHDGTVDGWEKSKLVIYLIQEDVKNILSQAAFLFRSAGYSSSKDEYYNILKKYTPAEKWDDTIESLIAPIEQAHFDNTVATIMKDHQLWPRLFAFCKKGGISSIVEYEKSLKPYYEKEILQLYLDHTEEQALIAEYRSYHEVARFLRRMRKFSGGNELVEQLLAKYRMLYKRRKIMMAELKGV